jgi:hypothetical protein
MLMKPLNIEHDTQSSYFSDTVEMFQNGLEKYVMQFTKISTLSGGVSKYDRR